MDKNSNFYKAIEEALIKPCSDEMKNFEETQHEFSDEYKKKLLEISKSCKEKNNSDSSGHKKIKMSFRLFSVILAAAILAGTVTVTANESARRYFYRIFSADIDMSSINEDELKTDKQIYKQAVQTTPLETDFIEAEVYEEVAELLSESALITSTKEVDMPTIETTVMPEYLIDLAENIVTQQLEENIVEQPILLESYPMDISDEAIQNVGEISDSNNVLVDNSEIIITDVNPIVTDQVTTETTEVVTGKKSDGNHLPNDKISEPTKGMITMEVVGDTYGTTIKTVNEPDAVDSTEGILVEPTENMLK